MLTLIALIVGGGLVPQTYLESRQRVVRAVFRDLSGQTNQNMTPAKKHD